MSATATSPAAKPASKSASERIFNFSAGPGCLPEEVLRQAQQDIWNIDGSGIGILEHSHRGKVFDRVLAEAEAGVRSVGNTPANYKVLFLTGGASTQNFMIPANLLPQGGTADYINTGHWAEKSIEEVKYYGTAHLAASSADKNHSYIPAQGDLKFSAKPAYLHYTSNNTIFGTEFNYVPTPPAGVPLVCDASSDIYSRPWDISKFGLIYAGAQKNMGAAGTTVLWIRDDVIERCNKNLPSMLRFGVHAKDGSRHNTPPVFAIYVVGLCMKWLKNFEYAGKNGVAAMEVFNKEKAKHVYDVLDKSQFYKGHARPDSRSLMNLTFRTPSEQLDEAFVKEAKSAGLDGLKGHRSTGGMRASLYNAFPMAGAKALADFMREFERKNG
jgi:phosphoserine aminotransferase